MLFFSVEIEKKWKKTNETKNQTWFKVVTYGWGRAQEGEKRDIAENALKKKKRFDFETITSLNNS